MVFGSPGSGSIIICTDLDPSIIKQNSKKNLDFYRVPVPVLFCDFFKTLSFLKNDLSISSKSNEENNLEKKFTDEKSGIRIRIRICKSVVRICGSGSESEPKCHGSALVNSYHSLQRSLIGRTEEHPAGHCTYQTEEIHFR
jgi:hypothetical protein